MLVGEKGAVKNGAITRMMGLGRDLQLRSTQVLPGICDISFRCKDVFAAYHLSCL